MKILDFQLSVTPLGGDRYLIRTEKVEPGVPLAEEQVDWPVERWLNLTRQLMADPLVQFLQPEPESHNPPPDLLTLGQDLYHHLFTATVRDSWIAAQSIAYHQQGSLRLRLGLKGDRLPCLPWEVLQAPPQGNNGGRFRPLATGTDVLFSRYGAGTIGEGATGGQGTAQPLKVLMAIAQPHDQQSLTLGQEVQHLRQELSQAQPTPITLKILEQPGREALTQALEQGNYDLFHYAGHSSLGSTGGDLALVNPLTGLTESLTGDDLAGLLRNNGIQGAIFNSCRSGPNIFAQPQERNLAQALVQQGVPAVLAMAEEIPDAVALTLTQLLYRNLSLGHPLDLCVSRMRQGLLSAYGSGQLYWALPILYLNPMLHSSLTYAIAPMDAESDEDRLPAWLKTEMAQAPEPELVTADPAADADMAALMGEIFPDLNGESALAKAEPTPIIIKPAPKPEEPKRSRPLWPYLAGGLGAIILAITGGWLIQQWGANPPNVVVASPDGDNFGEVSSERLTSFAIEALNGGNLTEGLQAVTALLDRNALPLAESALAAIPADQLDQPAVSFLRGRLAWQSALLDNPRYSPSDARRYWETAVKAAPDNAHYQTALGFAYYSEGLINLANQAWYEAIARLEEQAPPNDPETQMPYAGLALGLTAIAAEANPDQASTLTRQATALRRQVLNAHPRSFQTQALSQHWLWTPAMIAAWEELNS
ncbi:CHAT domain-containing protein [Spirulina sp. CCNP1310]|uniref:CHAT domain-containing protein n=1 Tax=Spirulina sp. CCNP1310 TaxID=3110249 RepID=UPI002B219592|nr:CHAT domain-containing protein [Spirulina sp. CCNP1310]MEA5419649.1 CHAT domain-containing protein [Spirulina sp. CCNP1310]